MRLRPRLAFTLVELLVTMGVLTLLIALITQLIGSATNTTTQSNKHVDADTAAREVLDRMGRDFARMIKRSDVDYAFNYQNGASGGANDQMYFFCQSNDFYNGSVTSNPISLAGYCVRPSLGSSGNTPDYYQLARLGWLLDWSSEKQTSANKTSLVYLPLTIFGTFGNSSGAADATTITNPYNTNVNTGTNAPYEVVGDQVFRMEYFFLLKDGTLSKIPVIKNVGTTNNLARLQRLPLPISPVIPPGRDGISKALK